MMSQGRRPWHRLPTAKVLCFLLFFAALMIYSTGDQPELAGDSPIYVLLAQSLVSGEGYKDVAKVGSPPHTKYPPVFPLLLAPVVYLYGLNLQAMVLLVTALGVAALWAVYILFRRVSDARMAFTVLVLTGVSHGVWFHSHSILSEIPYLLFSSLSLFFLEEYKREEDTAGKSRFPGKIWITALTIGLASLTRIIGIAVLVGGVAYLTLEGRKAARRDARQRLTRTAALAVMASAPVILWCLRNWMVSNSTTAVAYLQEYGLKNYASVDSTITGLEDFFQLIAHNLYIYSWACSEIVLPYFPWLPEKVTAALLTTIVVLGFFICLTKRRSVLEYYVIPYTCALLLFPASYPRYLIPIVPIILYYFLVGIYEISQLLLIRYNFSSRQFASSSIFVITAIVVGIANLVFAFDKSIIDNQGEHSYRVDGEEGRYIDVLAWVEKNTDPTSVFMWAKMDSRYLTAKRRGLPIFSTLDGEKILASIDRLNVSYVVIDSFSNSSLRYLKPVIDKHPERFSLVYQNKTSQVYKVIM